MLILISQLVSQPVITFDDAQILGVVRDPIIDPDNGRLVGYFIGYGFMAMKRGIVEAEDIVAYDGNRLIVQADKAIQQLEETPKITKLLKRKIPVHGAPVLTESGKHLGRANDLLLDTELGMIVRYYVHGMIQDRIIAADQVIGIERRGIIVNDTSTAPGGVIAEAEM